MNKSCSNQSPSRASADRDAAQNLQRRHIRVTVKYNRKELQRRMEVEKWIDCELEELYKGRVSTTSTTTNVTTGTTHYKHYYEYSWGQKV